MLDELELKDATCILKLLVPMLVIDRDIDS